MHLKGGFSKAYNEQGVGEFYQAHTTSYSNPHRYDIERVLRKKLTKSPSYLPTNSRILDLACGSGQVTVPLMAMGYHNIQGCDPYTAELYSTKTMRPCEKFSFTDILQGKYQERKFDCVICSYAMHLVKQTMLFDFCNKLATMSKFLIIVSPHKFPIMKPEFGWEELENFVMDKIHYRVFKSCCYQQPLKNQQQAQKN